MKAAGTPPPGGAAPSQRERVEREMEAIRRSIDEELAADRARELVTPQPAAGIPTVLPVVEPGPPAAAPEAQWGGLPGEEPASAHAHEEAVHEPHYDEGWLTSRVEASKAAMEKEKKLQAQESSRDSSASRHWENMRLRAHGQHALRDDAHEEGDGWDPGGLDGDGELPTRSPQTATTTAGPWTPNVEGGHAWWLYALLLLLLLAAAVYGLYKFTRPS